MTLLQLSKHTQAQADNEFTDIDIFLSLLNIIIMDINLQHSAKFIIIDDATVDMSLDITTLTGMPNEYNSILIAGVTWKLQQKEAALDWLEYEKEYIRLRNKYKHLVPDEYKLDTFNDIQYRTNSTKWEIF